MTPEEMKSTWNESITRIDKKRDYNFMLMEKQHTAIERLAHRYLRFSRFCLIFACLNPIMLHTYTSLPNSIKYISMIFMTLYFATAGVMDYWLYLKVSGIDIFNMKVNDVANLSLKYRKRHHQFMLILIVMAVICFSILGYGFCDDINAIIGMTVGLLVGASIGIRFYLKFMKDYKTLSKG